METAIAEKLEALVRLGMLNSRMKDFFDIWFLARTFPFESGTLAKAIGATFERRGTELDPEGFDTLIPELSTDASKRTQWRALLNRGKLVAPGNCADVGSAILQFVSLPPHASATGSSEPRSWPLVGLGSEQAKKPQNNAAGRHRVFRTGRIHCYVAPMQETSDGAPATEAGALEAIPMIRSIRSHISEALAQTGWT
jgi:hypothetical protein